VGDLLEKADLKANNNLYSSDRYGGGQKEVQIEAVWHNTIDEEVFAILKTMVKWKNIEQEAAIKAQRDKDDVTLTNCLREFKITETLDEDNKWYCSECKDHVIADKTMELYRSPPIMIITLKRFKTGG